MKILIVALVCVQVLLGAAAAILARRVMQELGELEELK